MPNRPWLRKLRVTLGPLEEWRGNTAGEAVTFDSDGTLQGLRVTGSIQKTIMGVPSPSTISIYNLAQDTRNGIKGSLTKVVLDAGWSNTELRRVFQGSILSAFSEREGPDIVTKLSCLPGYGALARAATATTAGAGLPVAAVLASIGSDLPGVEVNAGNFVGVDTRVGNGGWSFAGSTKDALTQLADEYGFSWTVDDGVLMAIKDKLILPEFVDLNGDNGGLISVSPIVSGPMQVETGVKATALYIPGVSAGNSVKITSSVTPRLNGVYRIHTLNISVDAYSEAWTMALESFKYM